MTFDEWWKSVACVDMKHCENCKIVRNCATVESLCRKSWEASKNNSNKPKKANTICVNCSHYSKEGNNDVCYLEITDYVSGITKRVCYPCRNLNFNGNCKNYEECTK